jgi:hypothetical protein
MGRPRKIKQLDLEQVINELPAEMPVEAPESASKAFFLYDPTSRPMKRIIRVHSIEERDRMIARGWRING